MGNLTEDWQIEYYMQTQKGVVHVSEILPCRLGYHQRLTEWGIDNRGRNTTDAKPISYVRGNYVGLLNLGVEEGRHLPLERRMELAGGELLASEEHPITLVAPNGTKYVHKSF